MFCPKCAAQNIEDASFCRVCGTDIHLVPQALAGRSPAKTDDDRAARRSRRRGRGASVEHAVKNIFVGVAFLVIATALSFTGRGGWWWVFMLIPAFSLLGQGVAEYIRFKEESKEPLPLSAYTPPVIAPPPVREPLPARNTGELLQSPPSVTEGTTRHLGAEAPTRTLDSHSDYPK
jgi:hypothetical protein